MRHVFYQNRQAIARITVLNSSGDLESGAAFHIGEGVYVTAKHVVCSPAGQDYEIREFIPAYSTERVDVTERHHHPNPAVDLSLLKTNYEYEDVVAVPRQSDDVLGDDLLLMKVLVMGFPSIPRSNGGELVAISAEINSIITRYDQTGIQFVISQIPRGGYSGGPVIGEFGSLIGVVSHSLTENDQPAEHGFFSVTTVDPLYRFLDAKGITPSKVGTPIGHGSGRLHLDS